MLVSPQVRSYSSEIETVVPLPALGAAENVNVTTLFLNDDVSVTPADVTDTRSGNLRSKVLRTGAAARSTVAVTEDPSPTTTTETLSRRNIAITATPRC